MKGDSKIRILIVGAGLAGATIARSLAEENFFVHIIDKRNHVAGNIFDFNNSNFERIHKYGPHLLHCNKNSPALKFLSKFTDWIPYEHKVRALLSDGRTTPLPINKLTIEDVFSKKFKNELEVKKFLDSIRNKNLIPKNTDEFFEASIGDKLANIFFRPYTKKMWGIHPKYLSIGIGSRLPIRTNNDTRYFNDNFQALPKNGYTKMIENMISHENIKLSLDTIYENQMEKDYEKIFLCIPIDQYYNYKFGILPYRSILFENRKEKGDDLESPVINFTDEGKYTRKTQWSLFPNSYQKANSVKTITYEIPCSMAENPDEYYYPVQTKESNILFNKYKKFSLRDSKLIFCGRTGLFRYIDMIPTVLIHLNMAKEFINTIKND